MHCRSHRVCLCLTEGDHNSSFFLSLSWSYLYATILWIYSGRNIKFSHLLTKSPSTIFSFTFTSILCGFVWTCAKSENQLCSGKTTLFFLDNMSIKMHVVVFLFCFFVCMWIIVLINNGVFFSLVLRSVVVVIMSVLLIGRVFLCVCTLQVSHQWVSGMCCWERVQMVLRRRCVPTRVCCLWTPRSETPTSPSWPLAYALTTWNGSRLLWLTTSATSSAWKTGEVWY